MDARYVTSLVDELESGGWARRENHPTDRRATVVTLTRVGVDVAAWMHAERDRTAQELFGQIRPARLKGFIAVARHVLTTIAE